MSNTNQSTLRQKILKCITDGSHFVDGQVRGLLIQDAVDQIEELMLTEMKKFGDFIAKNDWMVTTLAHEEPTLWEQVKVDENYKRISSEEEFTTDQILDEYFSQQVKG